MSMYTRCPHCETHFRVLREQLQVSSGQVRCGRCQKTFDAFGSLTSYPPATQLGTRSGGEISATTSDQPIRFISGSPVANPIPAAPAEPDLSRSGDQGSASQLTSRTNAPLTLPDDLFSPAPSRSQSGRWVWALGSLALALAVCVQVIYVFPAELSSRWPQLRPLLIESCTWLSCEVPLLRIPDQLFIEASDLQVLDTTRPGEILLTASIRNRAAFVQEFPLLELTLLDRLNQPAARKVFRPSEYLDKSQDSAKGVASNQEVPIRLYLDTGNIRPAGYRLYVFFA